MNGERGETAPTSNDSRWSPGTTNYGGAYDMGNDIISPMRIQVQGSIRLGGVLARIKPDEIVFGTHEIFEGK